MQETGEAIILREGSTHLDQCNYEQEGGLFGLCVCVRAWVFVCFRVGILGEEGTYSS